MDLRWNTMILLTLLGCGRVNSVAEFADGALNGACFPNGTCDPGLVCAEGTCRSPDPCFAVDCAGNGTCIVEAGQAVCSCNTGFFSSGATCLPCLTADCSTDCPAEMVEVLFGSGTVCVDRFEATAHRSATCDDPEPRGQFEDNYPEGFPDRVDSLGCTGTCRGESVSPETTPVYACSVAGVIPSSFITWFQAKRACENSGKRLCTGTEWSSACGGPAGSAYPYGDDYVPEFCNVADRGFQFKQLTGSMTDCEGAYPGLLDLSGNVTEWSALCPNDCTLHGGSYSPFSPHARISCTVTNRLAPALSDERLGFRCCL